MTDRPSALSALSALPGPAACAATSAPQAGQGVRVESPWVLCADSAQVIFTVAGLRRYRDVCARLGLGQELRSVRSREALVRLDLRILGLQAAEAERELAMQLALGTLPVQEREAAAAALSGDLDRALAANKLWQECAAAGPGVTPLACAKKQAKRNRPHGGGLGVN